ncbi:MAG: rod-binding protein [Clostridium sp.]|jgi:flagellar protein FlgJ|nr:rod-binding protein [Clostridium sp.]
MDISSLTSAYGDLYGTVAQQQTASKLENALGADTQPTDQELMDVCKQFESYFLEQVLKQMWKTVPESETVTGADATLLDFHKERMIQDLAAQSTERNSLGLAQSLYEQMKRNYGL